MPAGGTTATQPARYCTGMSKESCARITALLCLLLAGGCTGTRADPAAAHTLRIASWNLEWLVSPATTRNSRNACLAGREAALPCDTALGAARSSSDYAMLARYAQRLDADIIAIQEVEDAATAARVFPGYQFCMSGTHATQNVGFAIRRGLHYRCGPDVETLTQQGHGRHGATLVVNPGSPGELHLLAVHLKSGCARQRLDSPAAACRLLARQLPEVGAWLRAQTAAGHRHIVLGDFNRPLEPDARDGVWARLGAAAGPGATFRNAAEGTRFVSCYPGQTFTRYIDHILLGSPPQPGEVAGSFFRLRYDPADVRRYRLSDHCPVGIMLYSSRP